MRFAGFAVCLLAAATGGCAARRGTPANTPAVAAGLEVSGVWDALSETTIGEGIAAGDTRIEKEEWHLTQAGDAIHGYYIAALTFLSGDGRPYVCSRQPRFSTRQRFNVSGHVRGRQVEIDELEELAAQQGGSCDPGQRQLARYRGQLDGDVLTLVDGGQRRTLYRIHHPEAARALMDDGDSQTDAEAHPEPSLPERAAPPAASPASPPAGDPTNVSGFWIWEHRGVIPGGDEKQEREEWHLTQEGSALSGYYDRIVHQISLDGHAYRCSMAAEFQLVTRYRFTGEVRGDHVAIYESSFEVLDPNPCDNGKRRLDAYDGQASPDELRLVWGVGGQILRRARPDVPTHRF